MYIHSFLPIVALSLVSFSVADDPIPIFGGGAVTTDPSTLSKRGFSPSVKGPLRRGTASICKDLPQKWSYLGCYNDKANARALTGPSYCDDYGMAEEKCIEFCDAKGYSMAGVEFGKECYCGYSLSPSGTKASELDCSMTCSGNGDELCGAGDRLNVFSNGDAAPTVAPSVGDYQSLGCYSDSASSRTLTSRINLSGNVRVSDCTLACSNAGYPYAGLEFGDECYCGAEIDNGGAPIDASSCNMACTADKTQLCGGPAAINIYYSNKPVQVPAQVPTGWTSKKCYTDSVSSRTLSQKLSLDSSSMTVEGCLNACQDAGYTFGGLEYASECFCGNAIASTAQPATSGCDMACTGNHAEKCGGAARINVYQFQDDRCNYPGCYDGHGLIQEIYTSLPGCIAACKANANCVDIQYSHYAPEPNVCNLFNVPRSQNYAYGYETNAYCNSYSFYEKTCVVS